MFPILDFNMCDPLYEIHRKSLKYHVLIISGLNYSLRHLCFRCEDAKSLWEEAETDPIQRFVSIN